CILVPLQFWTMLLGGPTPGEWLGSVVLLVGLVVWASCLGTAISAVSLNTVSAVVRAFVILGLLRVVPYLTMVFGMVSRGGADGFGFGGVLFLGAAVVVLALPVAYRAFARIQRYAIDPEGRFGAALAISCLAAGALLGLALIADPEEPARLSQLLYPPSGLLLTNEYGLMGAFGGEEESPEPLLWLAALMFSLLGSAFFQSLAALGYEGQTHSRIWRILMFGTDTQ
ncbi:MAG: hypothetical protein KBI47_13435, partial [Armatimonadetes bacterium]|nr:hypothetical protein [Armatimonadota bacterium]